MAAKSGRGASTNRSRAHSRAVPSTTTALHMGLGVDALVQWMLAGLPSRGDESGAKEKQVLSPIRWLLDGWFRWFGFRALPWVMTHGTSAKRACLYCSVDAQPGRFH